MTLPAGVMDAFEIVPFETTEVMIASRYHEILTTSYGPDYMTPRQDKHAEMHAISLESEQERFAKDFN